MTYKYFGIYKKRVLGKTTFKWPGVSFLISEGMETAERERERDPTPHRTPLPFANVPKIDFNSKE